MPKSMPVIYETKPATEWICGEPVQKVSPKRTHALLQAALIRIVGPWADDRGELGTEWRFWLEPQGEAARYLVPDVAFVSYARRARNERDERDDESRFAPDVVFEILSPDDRRSNVEHKIDVYVRSGTSLVVLVDPEARAFRLVDCDAERTLTVADRFEHAELPGLAFELAAFFAVAT